MREIWQRSFCAALDARLAVTEVGSDVFHDVVCCCWCDTFGGFGECWKGQQLYEKTLNVLRGPTYPIADDVLLPGLPLIDGRTTSCSLDREAREIARAE